MREFIVNLGVMDRLVCNRSKEQTSWGTYFMKEVHKHGIELHVTEPYFHNQSKVEGVIREMRKKLCHVMLRMKTLHMLWYYGIKWVAEIMQRTAGLAGSLHYCTSLEETTGKLLISQSILNLNFMTGVGTMITPD